MSTAAGTLANYPLRYAYGAPPPVEEEVVDLGQLEQVHLIMLQDFRFSSSAHFEIPRQLRDM